MLALAVAAIYLRAAAVPFVLDDHPTILGNPSLRTLWPLSVPLSPPPYFPTAGRPLVNLSFAVNYALGGLDPVGYRLVDFALHALSAGLLFVLVRRTLQGLDPGRSATGTALLTAAVWAVHPLQSEAVVYVTQRTELLMGFCYLATLVASRWHLDARSSLQRVGWGALAVLACLAGMASKESMVSAPLLVLLYDRAFVSGSLAAAWRRSPALFAGLFASWALLLALNASGPRMDSAGFHLEVSPVAWWLTQARVFWMYLGLVVWPWPLVIHYELPYLETLRAAWPWLLATAALAGATAVALWRNRPEGLLWTAVFALLAPMWLVPIVTEVAAERRMYLPLAAILAWAIAGGARRLRRAGWPAPHGLGRAFVVAAAAALLLGLGAVTVRRLAAFRDPLTLWQDTVSHQPGNALAHNNLALALADAGRPDEAAIQLRIAIGLAPDDPKLPFNLGNVLAERDPGAALGPYEQAIRLWPGYAEAHNNLGSALVRLGRLDEAVASFERAVAHAPDFAEARYNLEQARRAQRRDQGGADGSSRR